MSTKHTPGPWNVKYSKFSIIETQEGAQVAECKNLTGLVNLQANARRIVACVNACEGIETSELEEIAVSGGMLGLREDVARAAKQRDALLEALEELVSEFGVCGLTEKARAAIAKATGEPQ